MSMTPEQFDALVGRIEQQAAANPTTYTLKLGAFAVLGYAYVFAVLLVLVAAGGLLAAAVFFKAALLLLIKKLFIPLLLFIGVVCKSMWVKFDPPKGMELRRGEFPDLFKVIDEVAAAASAPRAHVVLLTAELNAAVVQMPRLGMFGWQKNYLILGLPLMQLFTVDEFRAVLAHEFGHLSRAHGHFGTWIYRIREGWARLNDKLQEERHWGSFLFVPFFRWFAPTFAAYSFVLARRHEFEADALAKQTVGGKAMASALVRIRLKAEEMQQHYWPAIYQAADTSPIPVARPYEGLMNPDRQGFLPQADEQLRAALQRDTTTADTHPCLRERIRALGFEPELPASTSVDSAVMLLGPQRDSVIARFDEEWKQEALEWWKNRHEHVRTGRQKLEKFSSRPQEALSDVELYEYAQLVEEFDDAGKAFTLYELLVRERGAKKGAKYAYARALLGKGDATAISMLEEVMEEDEQAIAPCCELIIAYLDRHERRDEIQKYVDRYNQYWQKIDHAVQERDTIRIDDLFLPPELAPESVETLKRVLARKPVIKEGYLVCKHGTEGLPPIHVLGIVRKWRLRLESEDALQKLVQEVANEANLPDLLVIPCEKDTRKFAKHLKAIDRSRIYP
jgi:Zn-dependent protease with chaperone function